MTVTIIVDNEIWFQSDQVEELIILAGFLTVLEACGASRAVEMEKVEQIIATSY